MSPTRTRKPSLRLERDLQRNGYPVLAGMDEVGRGALAGPVSVGVVVIDTSCRTAPVGLRDSKLLAPARRESLVRPVRRWALAWGVGHAGAHEIDAVGIMAALRLAGRRALAAAGVRPDLVVLDGNHDWLTDPEREGLLGFLDDEAQSPSGSGAAPDEAFAATPPVRTVIKGDMTCSSVAAASILAKVERDAMMVDLHDVHPEYGWAGNKGYAAPEHRRALLELGVTELHRRSWNLLAAPQGVEGRPDVGEADGDLPDAGAHAAPRSDAEDDPRYDMMTTDDMTKVGAR